MLSRLASAVSSAVGWGSKCDISSDEDDDSGNQETDSLIDQILNDIFTKEDEGYVAPNHSKPVLPTIQTKLEAIGTVTRLTDKSGVIDNKYYFNRASIHCVGLDEGKEVTFSAYRDTTEHEWRVTQIFAVHDEKWNDQYSDDDGLEVKCDEIPVIPEEIEDNTGSANKRTINGVVKLKEGREIVVRYTVKPLKGAHETRETCFNLDEVSSDFLPMIGDVVRMNCIVEITEETADGSGSVVKVLSLQPSRARAFTGEVSAWLSRKGEGTIQEAANIFFNRAACESGYIPKKGDTVEVEAIEFERLGYDWRAISVRPDTICQRDENESVHRKTFYRIDPDLQLNKGNIVVQENTQFGALPASDQYKIEVFVSNEGQVQKKITKHYFESTSPNLTLVSPTNQQIWIEPQQTVTFCFKYNFKFLGCFSEVFIIQLGNIEIGRLIEWEVFTPDSSVVPSAPITENKFHEERSQHSQTYHELRSQREHIVRGRALVKRPNFVKVRLGHFPVNDDISNAMCQSQDNRYISKADARDALKKCCPVLSESLSEANHRSRFHDLLHIAEVDGSIDMCRYTKERVSFLKRGEGAEYLTLTVPGLAEGRPSVLTGDRVIAKSSSCGTKAAVFEGVIHKVLKDEVWLKFTPTFHASYNSEDYDVYFEQSRTCYRRCHAALDICHSNQAKLWLFPKGVKTKPPQVAIVESEETELEESKFDSDMYANRLKKLVWFNSRLNYRQKEAVRNIMLGEARPLPYIIFGPPGTGKTVTLVETVLQIYTLMSESRLLIATPSNSSANLLAERLLDTGRFQPGDMVRLVANHIIVEGKVPVKLVPYSATVDINAGADDQKRQNADKFQSHNGTTILRTRIIIGTCMALGQIIQLGLARGHFTHIIVDEAGQASEPEILIPLSFMAHESGQAILAGDPNQLGPVIPSQLASGFGLNKSLLARLLSRFPYQRDATGFPDTGGYDPRLVTRLSLNYRSLPDILELPSSLFYDSDLEPWLSEHDSYEAKLLEKATSVLNLPNSAVVFRGIRGDEMRDPDSPSFYNPYEMVEIVRSVILLLDADFNGEDIGIITPYQKQVTKIRYLLEKLGGESATGVKVGSVEEFQGQERMIIFISTVRSLGRAHLTSIKRNTAKQLLGFVNNPERLNVSISRARALLVICGDPVVLLVDKYWRSVVTYCINRNAYLGDTVPKQLLDL